MKCLLTLCPERYFRVVQGGLAVRSHSDLLQWLQGEIQYYLPHEIMLVLWGELEGKDLRHDIVSALPGVRSTDFQSKDLLTLQQNLHGCWSAFGKLPFRLGIGEYDLRLEGCDPLLTFGKALPGMRSIFVHGFSDASDGTDCLYAVFSSTDSPNDSTMAAMEYLLPYLDVALRRIGPLGSQAPKVHLVEETPKYLAVSELSARELEILNWVRIGKSNAEIGLILNISIHTVKNHIQKILKKLDVRNRMQAAVTTGVAQATKAKPGANSKHTLDPLFPRP